MASAHDDLVQQLRATFRVEAAEHLQALSDGLLLIEGNEGAVRVQAVEDVFRAVHSLKGASRAVEFPQLEMVCQAFEEVMDSWKRGHSAPGKPALDMLHKAIDAMTALLAGPLVPAAPVLADAMAARRSLQRLAQPAQTVALPRVPETPVVRVGEPVAPLAPAIQPAATGEPAARRTSVRVSTAALESQLLQAEEMLAAKLAIRERAADVSALAAQLNTWRRSWADVEQDARILRQHARRREGNVVMQARLDRVLDFLDTGMDALRTMEASAGEASRAADQDRYNVSKLVDDMLEQAKTLLLLPFSTVSGGFARLVRDLGQEQGKQIDFLLKGEETKLEKHILEEIKDPLIHLLRNCVDHGVEQPAARARSGKPAAARIALTVSRAEGNKVRIMLSDDGGGINMQAVTAAAVRAGVITEAAAGGLSREQVQELVFRSAVSSSAAVTRVSGRGLGLAIAREKVKALGGEISVESESDRGTRFQILLPVTRTTFRGILVEAGGQVMVVPTAQVERVGRVAASQVSLVDGRETLSLDGRAIPLVPLARMLKLAPPATAPEAAAPQRPPYLVIGSGERRVALSVDEVAGEQEVLVKPLRKPRPRVLNVAGTTILGSGQVACVLHVPDLLKSAQGRYGRPASLLAPAPAPEVSHQILVAEDSITSRMLLKAILETAGHTVTTAVDGAQAWELLHRQPFDLLVSDVEMPRLDGFGLTTKLRADAALAELPVILVTTLGSREDRERGVQAGANAYIVKGSFDQADLVETVRRLLG